jgi:hypothetical protein
MDTLFWIDCPVAQEIALRSTLKLVGDFLVVDVPNYCWDGIELFIQAIAPYRVGVERVFFYRQGVLQYSLPSSVWA